MNSIRICVIFLVVSMALTNGALAEYNHYIKPSLNENWWTRITNKSPWLREKFDVEFNFGRSVAVVVGIGDYDEWADLPSTVTDAKNVFKFLRDEADFDEIYLMTDRDVTLGRISDLMRDKLPRSLKNNDRFIFYWAGHGGRIENRSMGYLPLSSGDHKGSGALDMLQVQAWMRFLSPRHALFVIDACHAGAAALSARSKDSLDIELNKSATVERLSRPAYFMLNSSASDESSYGYSDGTGGAFTKAFLSALRGNGDIYPKDGIITLSEATLYIQVQLEKIAEINGFRFLQSAHKFHISNRDSSGEFFFVNPQTSSLEAEDASSPIIERGSAIIRESGVDNDSRLIEKIETIPQGYTKVRDRLTISPSYSEWRPVNGLKNSFTGPHQVKAKYIDLEYYVKSPVSSKSYISNYRPSSRELNTSDQDRNILPTVGEDYKCGEYIRTFTPSRFFKKVHGYISTFENGKPIYKYIDVKYKVHEGQIQWRKIECNNPVMTGDLKETFQELGGVSLGETLQNIQNIFREPVLSDRRDLGSSAIINDDYKPAIINDDYRPAIINDDYRPAIIQ